MILILLPILFIKQMPLLFPGDLIRQVSNSLTVSRSKKNSCDLSNTLVLYKTFTTLRGPEKNGSHNVLDTSKEEIWLV